MYHYRYNQNLLHMKKICFTRLVTMAILFFIGLSFMLPDAQGQTCVPPSAIFTGSAAPDVASFQWLQVPGANKYKLRIKPFKTQTWTNYSANVPLLQISPYVGYYTFQMRSICSSLKSDWTSNDEACFNCKVEIEPNEKLSDALMTEGGEEYWVTGMISVSGDTDFFCIKPFPGDGYLTVSLNYGGPEKYRIAAYTKSGTYLGASSGQLKNLNGNDTICFMVYGKDASQFNDKKSYSVLVKRTIDPQRYGVDDLQGNTTAAFLQHYDISIYPNPARDAITISSNAFQSGNIEIKHIEIYNAIGEKIIYRTIDNTANENYHLNLSGLPPGIYLLQLICGTTTVTEKFVIE